MGAGRALVVIMALTAMGFASACGSGGGAASSSATPAATATRAGQGGRVVKAGDKVTVHYTGTLDDGKQFDSSKGGDPLKFTVGAGQMIPGFDRAVLGMEVGKSVKVHLDPKDAYGERSESLIVKVPADQAPPGLTVGTRVAYGGRPATITAVTPEGVTVDTNHELAGQALNFEIELVSIDN